MMPPQRLQKGDDYTKKLVRLTPENCALIQAWADATHLSFTAALNAYLSESLPPERMQTMARKARKARRTPATTPV